MNTIILTQKQKNKHPEIQYYEYICFESPNSSNEQGQEKIPYTNIEDL